jgi:AraC-like DNA-binding protein
MHYEEILPSPLLRKYVKCFWVLKKIDNSIPNTLETVLPDGTLEIVFNLADSFRRSYTDGRTEIQPRTILVGQMRQFIQIAPLGQIDLFGVRFQTIGAYHFFKFSLSEVTNQIQPLNLVLEKTDQYLEEQINEALNNRERISMIENFLTRKLSEKSHADQPTESVVENILQNQGMVSISQTAKEFGISQRQLERHFRQKIGVSPKFLCRIIRLQNLLNALRKSESKDFSQAAMSFGYYDQSHFIHEFREFAGASPTVFLKEENQMTELFSS